MKKVKITGKLNLDKMAIAKLNDSQTPSIVGGSTLFPRCNTRIPECNTKSAGRFCIQTLFRKTQLC